MGFSLSPFSILHTKPSITMFLQQSFQCGLHGCSSWCHLSYSFSGISCIFHIKSRRLIEFCFILARVWQNPFIRSVVLLNNIGKFIFIILATDKHGLDLYPQCWGPTLRPAHARDTLLLRYTHMSWFILEIEASYVA